MSHYKTPSLLNPPLIAMMCLSAAIPLATYFLYYSAQVEEKERLVSNNKKLNDELLKMVATAAQADRVLADTQTEQAAMQQFALRFFRTMEDAQRFLADNEDRFTTALRRHGLVRAEAQTGSTGQSPVVEMRYDYPFKGEIGNYVTGAYVKEYGVAGPHTALYEFLRAIHSLQISVRYPRAAYVQMQLPEGIELPDFTNEELRREILHDVTQLPLFFERDHSADDSSGRTGKVWFLCRPHFPGIPDDKVTETREMTADQMRSAIGRSTSEAWKRSIERLRDHIAKGRPMVPQSIYFSGTTGERICEVTGLPCDYHDVSPFFYVDKFELLPNAYSQDSHTLRVRIVIPIWDEEKAQAYLQASAQAAAAD